MAPPIFPFAIGLAGRPYSVSTTVLHPDYAEAA